MTLFSNATGKGAYVENLLKQREILASEYDSETSPRPMTRKEVAPTPQDQPSQFAQPKAEQRRSDTTGGIMRPKIRPDTSSLYQGQEYLRAIQDQEGPYAPEESPRPKARSDSYRKGGYTDKGKQLYGKLIERGFEPHVAEGFVMNFKDESGFDPNINEANPEVKGSRGGFGLYQLTGTRRKQYESFAKDRNASLGDIDTQLDFLELELKTTEKEAMSKIEKTSTSGGAGIAILNHFLRPKQKHRPAREARYKRNTE
jgi:hypothetical protein